MPSRSLAVGLAAAAVTLLVGAGWQITTRFGVTTSLAPIDLALLRYAGPGLILLPVALRRGLMPANVHPMLLLFMFLGAGLPFGLLAMAGASLAPVTYMATLIPGGMALFIAIVSRAVTGQPWTLARWVGLTMIFMGLAAQTSSGLFASGTTLTGSALFLAAALLWAGYTVAFSRAGLDPLYAISVISVWSMVAAVILWLVRPEGRLLVAPWPDLALQIVVQSVLAGVVAMWAYGIATRHLGAITTGALGALSPVIASIAGYVLLAEQLTIAQLVAIVLISSGVALASGAIETLSERSAARSPPSAG